MRLFGALLWQQCAIATPADDQACVAVLARRSGALFGSRSQGIVALARIGRQTYHLPLLPPPGRVRRRMHRQAVESDGPHTPENRCCCSCCSGCSCSAPRSVWRWRNRVRRLDEPRSSVPLAVPADRCFRLLAVFWCRRLPHAPAPCANHQSSVQSHHSGERHVQTAHS